MQSNWWNRFFSKKEEDKVVLHTASEVKRTLNGAEKTNKPPQSNGEAIASMPEEDNRIEEELKYSDDSNEKKLEKMYEEEQNMEHKLKHSKASGVTVSVLVGQLQDSLNSELTSTLQLLLTQGGDTTTTRKKLVIALKYWPGTDSHSYTLLYSYLQALFSTWKTSTNRYIQYEAAYYWIQETCFTSLADDKIEDQQITSVFEQLLRASSLKTHSLLDCRRRTR